MDEYAHVSCQRCGQKMRLPADLGRLLITCRKCGHKFEWPTESKIKWKTVGAITAGAVVLVALIFALVIGNSGGEQQESAKPGVQARRTDSTVASETAIICSPQTFTVGKWVVVSYGQLIDREQITRTGQTLAAELNELNAADDPVVRGIVQPYVDSYSRLLQHAIEMFNGPDEYPHRNVVDHFPVGSAQPAWVGIFRGGRILVTSDGVKHCRVFLPGENPEEAYRGKYSVIRHCLAGLLPQDGSELTVEVLAYENDYSRSELKLNLQPYTIRAREFRPQQSVTTIDVAGLSRFLRRGGTLEGGQLTRGEGLVLFAKPGSHQTAIGSSMSIADLATVYRAVFHAGDNEAFVSLDPHVDPTRVSVSFGGFLEDTPVGSVLLESDKRFKTITSGLDPNSFRDMREHTRSYVSGFLSASELDWVFDSGAPAGQWIKTRFWYYPDSVVVETDSTREHAKIATARFVADAERGRDDFASPEQFERMKKTKLSPSIRESIARLNRSYDDFAGAYPELKELSSVARLFGICCWLRKCKASSFDLDALLSVELPAFRTDRDKTKLMAVTMLGAKRGRRPNESYIRENARVFNLSELLDKKCVEYFPNATDLAEFLCCKNNVDSSQATRYEREASQLLQDYSGRKVRQLIRSEKDVKAFVQYASSKCNLPLPPEIEKLRDDLERDKRQLEAIENRMTKLREAAEATRSNREIDSYNAQVREYKVTLEKYNSKVHEYNLLVPDTRLMASEISGGINVGPDNFHVLEKSGSPDLRRFIEVCKAPNPENNGMISSRGDHAKSDSFPNRIQKTNWGTRIDQPNEGIRQSHMTSRSGHEYFLMRDLANDVWRDRYSDGQNLHRERRFDGAKGTLILETTEMGEGARQFVAQMTANKIVFTELRSGGFEEKGGRPNWWLVQPAANGTVDGR